ncbi:transposase [Aeromonas salmonicida]
MVYTNSSSKGRANYSREFKQRLVDAANQPSVSVSKLAQEHGVNANLLFKWRRDASLRPFLAMSTASVQRRPSARNVVELCHTLEKILLNT